MATDYRKLCVEPCEKNPARKKKLNFGYPLVLLNKERNEPKKFKVFVEQIKSV